jgi:hypothetical protein
VPTRSTVLAERLSAQLLSGEPAGSVVDVVRRVLAVQAQDPRGARLAVRARSSGLSAGDVDRALTADRSVVVSTVNRGTLHLMCSEDYWWLHPLTTPQLTAGSARRLAQERVTPEAADRGVEVIMETLTSDGPTGRDALRERIAAAGVRVEGQAFAHIVLLATIRGLIVRGPIVDGSHAFVLVRDWLGKPPKSLKRDVSLGELARRYLAGHQPASPHDLARWAGVTLGDARRGFAAVGGSLVERSDGLAALEDASPDSMPPPRLLGSFDPVLHGWVSREPIIGSHEGIVTSNGVFRPFAMVGGRAVATWTIKRGRVTLSPFVPISRTDQAVLDADAQAVIGFLGLA